MSGERPRHEALYISVSQIKTYLRCPRQYELHYIRGETPAFVPVALAFGSAFHTALAHFYGGLKSTGVPPQLDELVEAFTNAWEGALSGPVPLQVDDDDDIDHVQKGATMLRVFHAHAVAGPTCVVEKVELQFSVDLHDPDTGEVLEEKLVGAIDLVVREGDARVLVEHKTAGRRWTADQLHHDLQVAAYKIAAREVGLGVVGLRYQVFTKTKLPAVQIEDVERDAQAEDDFLRTAVGVLRAIDVGAFWPNRVQWQCATCAYAHACIGA